MNPSELHPDCLVCRWNVEGAFGEECPGRGPAEPCDDFEPARNRQGTLDPETGDEAAGGASKTVADYSTNYDKNYSKIMSGGNRVAVPPAAARAVAGAPVPPRRGAAVVRDFGFGISDCGFEEGGNRVPLCGGGGDEVLVQVHRELARAASASVNRQSSIVNRKSLSVAGMDCPAGNVTDGSHGPAGDALQCPRAGARFGRGQGDGPRGWTA